MNDKKKKRAILDALVRYLGYGREVSEVRT